MLRERLTEKDETIADLRRRLDDSETERRQAQERLTALLTRAWKAQTGQC
jgi:hypothetical protein